jgi:hypothetical protein
LLDRLAHAANAVRHRAHDVGGEIRHLVDHEAEFALIDDRQFGGFPDPRRRRAPSMTDMKPIASLGPQTSITLSWITISTTPDCTTYMQLPASPWLNTTLPAGNVILVPALAANSRISISAMPHPP